MNYCPHPGHREGWTLDPTSGQWVHALPSCRLPSRLNVEREDLI